MSKTRALFLAIAAMSLSATPALAQGWDDAGAPPPEAPQAPQKSPEEVRLETLKAQEAERVNRLVQSHAKSPQQAAQLRSMLQMQGIGYAENPERQEKEFRMSVGANGQVILEEDNRPPMPAYQGGFGNIKQQKSEPGLAPLTADMVQVPQQQAENGQGMFENTEDKGFFGGLKPPSKPLEVNQKDLQIWKRTEPAWGKDRIQNMHKYIDGQEHPGNEDEHGFF